MSDRGRAVCRSLHAEYPAALDEAMTARMHRDVDDLENAAGGVARDPS